jgi:hypothetical protein
MLGKSDEDGTTDLAYDCGERAREHEGVVQEDGCVEGWVEFSAWEDLVVDDAVGHCLLVGVGEEAWGGFREREKGGGFW